MPFIRPKGGKARWWGKSTHYSVVVNARDDDGKVKQKVILYLGPCDSVEEAIMHFREKARHQQCRALAHKAAEEAARSEAEKCQKVFEECAASNPTLRKMQRRIQRRNRDHFRRVVKRRKKAGEIAFREAEKYEASASQCEAYLDAIGSKQRTKMFVCGCHECVRIRPLYVSRAPFYLAEGARVVGEIPVVPTSADYLALELGTTSDSTSGVMPKCGPDLGHMEALHFDDQPLPAILPLGYRK